MKKMLRMAISCVLSAVMCVAWIPMASAAETTSNTVFEEGGIKYMVTDATSVQVGDNTAGSGLADASTTVVNIPATVTYQGTTYNVKRIGTYAFEETNVSSVTLSEGLEIVGMYSFGYCHKLKSICFPASVSKIYEGSFFQCDALQNVEFAEGSELTSIGSNAFAMLSDNAQMNKGTYEGAIESIVFPEKLDVINGYAFYGQTKLASITFKAKSMSYIMSYAFSMCTSLTRVDLPVFTGSPLILWGGTFSGCSSLETLTYAGPMNFNRNASYELSGCTSLKTVVYYDKGDQDPSIISEFRFSDALALPDTVDIYYTVDYYGSKADALAKTNKLGSVQVHKDTPLYQVASGDFTAENAVYSGAAIPGSWSFEGDLTGTDKLTESIYAYQVNESDLSSGSIGMDAQLDDDGVYQFTYYGELIDLGLKVYSASGALLKEGADYTVQVKNAAGAVVDAKALEQTGTYSLTVTAAAGGAYSGSLTASFSISTITPEWLDVTGADSSKLSFNTAINSYGFAGNYGYTGMFDELAKENIYVTTSYAVVANADDLGGAAAAAALAGALKAPVLLTSAKSLSAGCHDGIIYTGAETVIIVGGADAVSQDVQGAIKNLSGVDSVYRINASDAQTLSAKAYTLGSGDTIGAKFGGDWCVVAADGSKVDELLASSWAYANAAPLFLCSAKGALSSTVKSAIEEGGFKNVLVVGAKAANAQSALESLGLAASCINGDTATAESSALADWAIANGTLNASSVTLANVDEVDCLGAASTLSGCPSRMGVLVLTNGGTDYMDAVAYVQKLRYKIAQGEFCGELVSSSLKQRIAAIWDSSIDTSKIKDVAATKDNKVTFTSVNKTLAGKSGKLAKNASFTLKASCLGGAKLTFKKKSGNAKITVASSGKVTVKKGLKTGIYTVKVQVTAAAKGFYSKATTTGTFKVAIK